MIINLTTGFLVRATLLTLRGNGTGSGFLEYKDRHIQMSSSSPMLQTHNLYKICVNLNFRGYPLFKLLIRSNTTETVYRVDRCIYHCYDLYLECNAKFPYRLDGNGDIRLWFESKWSALCFSTPFTFEQASEFCEKFNLPSSNVEVIRGSFGGYEDSWRITDTCSSKLTNTCTSVRRLTAEACTPETLAAIKCEKLVPEFRLLDLGRTRHWGMLEVKFGKTWKPVCSLGFTLDDAKVACRTLGYNSSDANYHHRKFGPSGLTRYPGQFRCSGAEASLTNCPGLEQDYRYCYSTYVTDISCAEAQEGKLRLTGGYDRLSGRLEVFHNNVWGTVCNNSFEGPEISTACNQVSSGDAKKGKHISAVVVLPELTTKDILLDGVDCAWIQSKLVDCPHYTGVVQNCYNNDVVYLSCMEEQNEFRLEGGGDSYGRLEVFHDNQWGSICSKNVGESEAITVCESLGLNSILARVGTPVPSHNSARIWLDKLRCDKGVKHLKDCVLGSWGQVTSECSDDMDLWIYCGKPDKTRAKFHLYGSATRESEVGVVMFSYSSRDLHLRGGVCMESPSHNIAVVACSTLGLPSMDAALLSETVFPRPSSDSALNGVTCTGHELHLLDCQFSSVKRTSFCEYQNKLVVACGSSPLPDYSLRLVDDYSTTSGRLQVLLYGVWGAVCRNGFDSKSAEVACRKLGLPTSKPSVLYTRGGVTDMAWLSDVSCHGWEDGLQHCRSSLSPGSCPGDGKAVSIKCAKYTYYVPAKPIMGGILAGLLVMTGIIILVCYVVKRRRRFRPPSRTRQPPAPIAMIERMSRDREPAERVLPSGQGLHQDYVPTSEIYPLSRQPGDIDETQPPPSYDDLFPEGCPVSKEQDRGHSNRFLTEGNQSEATQNNSAQGRQNFNSLGQNDQRQYQRNFQHSWKHQGSDTQTQLAHTSRRRPDGGVPGGFTERHQNAHNQGHSFQTPSEQPSPQRCSRPEVRRLSRTSRLHEDGQSRGLISMSYGPDAQRMNNPERPYHDSPDSFIPPSQNERASSVSRQGVKGISSTSRDQCDVSRSNSERSGTVEHSIHKRQYPIPEPPHQTREYRTASRYPDLDGVFREQPSQMRQERLVSGRSLDPRQDQSVNDRSEVNHNYSPPSSQGSIVLEHGNQRCFRKEVCGCPPQKRAYRDSRRPSMNENTSSTLHVDAHSVPQRSQQGCQYGPRDEDRNYIQNGRGSPFTFQHHDNLEFSV